jgi:hypothetical protein
VGALRLSGRTGVGKGVGLRSRSGHGSAAARGVLDGDIHVASGNPPARDGGMRSGLAPDAGAGARAFAPRQQAQLWEGDRAHQVHAVVVGPDSVSAIPFVRPVECDSCRLIWPRSVVDSVRVGSPVAGFWKTVGLIVAAFMAVCAPWCVQPGT